MRDVHLEYSREFKDVHVKYSSRIRKNRPDSDRIFQAYIESGVLEYLRLYFGIRVLRAWIRIWANLGPNIGGFAQ